MKTDTPLYIFRSGTSESLHGFAADPKGDQLPAKFGPWTGIGVVRADQPPPYGFKRAAIDEGIAKTGYQLWRMKEKV
jgi:hypothetical protein